MRTIRLVVAICVLLQALTFPSEAYAKSWEKVLMHVSQSVVRLNITDEKFSGICSAFSINEKDHLFLTAAHCYGRFIEVGGNQAQVVYFNKDSDLMVLVIPGEKREAVPHAKGPASLGQSVAAIGFANGWRVPSAKVGSVMVPKLHIQDVNTEGEPIDDDFLVTDFSFVGGQSGGPVVNTEGQAVGVIQMANQTTGLSRPLDRVLAEVGQYWK